MHKVVELDQMARMEAEVYVPRKYTADQSGVLGVVAVIACIRQLCSDQ